MASCWRCATPDCRAAPLDPVVPAAGRQPQPSDCPEAAGQRPALPSRGTQRRQRFGLQPLVDLELVIHRRAPRLLEGLAVGVGGIGALFFPTQTIGSAVARPVATSTSAGRSATRSGAARPASVSW
ncbi:hypothetical protein G6F56_013871 [Rhizopus delemar]|nr:hypothetical protein G6F56_013871 [Rhizopus delemar]